MEIDDICYWWCEVKVVWSNLILNRLFSRDTNINYLKPNNCTAMQAKAICLKPVLVQFYSYAHHRGLEKHFVQKRTTNEKGITDYNLPTKKQFSSVDVHFTAYDMFPTSCFILKESVFRRFRWMYCMPYLKSPYSNQTQELSKCIVFDRKLPPVTQYKRCGTPNKMKKKHTGG